MAECKYDWCEEDVFKDGCCILHVELPEDKNSAEFERINDLKNEEVKKRIKKDGNLTNARLFELKLYDEDIDVDLDLSDAKIEKYLRFKNCTFGGRIFFTSMEVKGNIVFYSCQINGNIDLENSSIDGRFYIKSPDERTLINGSIFMAFIKVVKGVVLIDVDINGKVDFESAVELGNISFTSTTIQDELSFFGAKKVGSIEFEGDNSLIKTNLSLEHAEILGNVDFESLKTNEVKCDSVKIGGNVNFEKSKIDHDVDFTSSVIKGNLNFRSSTIGGDAKFISSILNKNVIFENSKIMRKAKFDNAKISSEVNFSGADVSGTIRFLFAKIDGNANFNRLHAYENVEFAFAHINNNISFFAAHIYGGTYFDNTIIKGSANFSALIADKLISFSRATIEEGISFLNSQFNEKLDFSHFKSNGSINFEETNIENANFIFARIGEVYFKNIDSRINLNFNNASILNSAIFDKINHIKASFENAVLNTTVFRECNLSNVRFKYCILNNCELSTSYWDNNIIPERLDYDKNILNAHELADTYKRIKQCLQNEGAYNEAGDFYICEMDMRRKVYWKSDKLSWIFYTILSGTCKYGEKPSRPFYAFLGMISFFGLVFWKFNCLIIDDGNSDLIGNLTSSFCYSALNSVTLSFNSLQPKPGIPVIISMIEAGISTFLIALFIYVFSRKMSR